MLESESVYAVRDGPASGTTLKVCAVPLRFVTVRVRVAGAPAALTMPKSSSDALSELWKNVDQAISAILDHTTFAELARRWKESQRRYVPNWEI